jgi:hypothetical protein
MYTLRSWIASLNEVRYIHARWYVYSYTVIIPLQCQNYELGFKVKDSVPNPHHSFPHPVGVREMERRKLYWDRKMGIRSMDSLNAKAAYIRPLRDVH